LTVALTHLTGCVSVERRVVADRAASVAEDATETIYVVRRGWHVEVALAAVDAKSPPLAPAKIENRPLAAVAAKFPGGRYLSVESRRV
jgi:hypothetical protein